MEFTTQLMLENYLHNQEIKKNKMLKESIQTIKHNKNYYMPYIKELLNRFTKKSKRKEILKIFLPKTKKPKIYELNNLGKESKCEICNNTNSFYSIYLDHKTISIKICKDCLKEVLTK